MMVMTNYMDLLAMHQPWNLILFMVLPVVLAESLVATEFYVTYYRKEGAGNWKKWNHRLGIAAGGYFLLVFLYLMTNVVPGLSWKGWTDELAIWAYLLGIVPLGAIALMELGIIGKHATEHQRTMRHFGLLIGFLVVSHVAMVFGMVDPTLSGWRPAGAPMQKAWTTAPCRACSSRQFPKKETGFWPLPTAPRAKPPTLPRTWITAVPITTMAIGRVVPAGATTRTAGEMPIPETAKTGRLPAGAAMAMPIRTTGA